MERKYNKVLLNEIVKRQEIKRIHGIDVLVKHIPDSEESGVLDPRLYHAGKKQYIMMKFLPKGLLKMDASPESIRGLRKIFNGIKSIPIVTAEISVENTKVEGTKGDLIPIRIYKPSKIKKDSPVLLYFHGGGFFAGTLEVIDELLKLIVENEGIPVISVDYRLSPEYPYPAGHQDCFDVLSWLYQNASELGMSKDKIIVSGDSAGGNLTQYCSIRDRELDTHMIRGQILLYPTVNMGGIKDPLSNRDFNQYEINPKQEKIINMMLTMMGDSGNLLGKILGVSQEEIKSPYLTPYGAELEGLPPTMITFGEFDFLKVECMAFAVKLNQASVKTKTILYKGLGHAYGDNIGVYPQSEDCAVEMGKFIRELCENTYR